MTSPNTPTATSERTYLEQRLEEFKTSRSKTDINLMVMDYLINEGYPSAARKFSIEANIPNAEALAYVDDRVGIKNYILKGDIQAAIEEINDLNPEILDTNPALHFALLRLQLVELIRACHDTPNMKKNISTVISFASTKLGPRAKENPQFLEDLERTMATLLLPLDGMPSQFASILHPDLRCLVAGQVNEAILSSQGFRKDARMRNLVRLRAWAEAGAREAKQITPKTDLDLRLDDGHGNASQTNTSQGNAMTGIVQSPNVG
ncbi:MAG: hypothetical protein M1814_000736 [Vezdaea aestivalis]|nr:MAG: hypothetical protein M1814_000736 [Vezdaea aestivalis]